MNTMNGAVAHERRWCVVVALLNAVLLSAITATIVPWTDTSLDWQGCLYLLFALPVQFVLLSMLVLLPLYLLTRLLPRPRWRRVAFFMAYFLASLLILANVKVFELYRFHLNAMVVNLVFGGAFLDIMSFSVRMWASVAGIALIVGALQWGLLRLADVCEQRAAGKRTWMTLPVLFGAALSLIVLVQLAHALADARGLRNITAQDRYIPWLQSLTMRKSLARMGLTVIATHDETLAAKNSGLNYPLSALQCDEAHPLNIVMLVVDSLRADMLTPEVMPHSFQFGQQSLHYLNHFSTGNATRYGLFGLLYGLPGSYWPAMLSERRGSALFDATLSLGYQHFIFGSAPLSSPEFDRTALAAVRADIVNGSAGGSAPNDQQITGKLINRIEHRDLDKPFFAFAFLDSPHAFAVPDQYAKQFQPMLAEVNYVALNKDYDALPFINRYKASVYYDDALIGSILDSLQQQNLLSNSIVIITGDHGQEFNETHKNYWGHNSDFTRWQTQVPMLIHWPGQAAQAVEAVSSHEDIVPTLMQMALHCTTPIDHYSTGINLLEPMPPQRQLVLESWTERAIRDGDKLYVFDQLGSMRVLNESYDEIPNARLNSGTMQQSLQRMSLFLKR